ncbi:MAG: DUF6941 family protein [Desulfovibrio sp.]|uniref:DUF6941 family protein n=1 Tax=Desulfovibrio sp. 7SRBS1 TaxID=3378064 RepID=UPI003B41B52E
MLTVFHSVLCGDTLTDTRTGQVSYIKVIESINTPRFPAAIQGAFIGMLCQADADGVPSTVRIDLVAPDKTALPLKQFELSLTATPQKVLIRLEQILFAQPGMHVALISTNIGKVWKPLASMPIIVQQTKAA